MAKVTFKTVSAFAGPAESPGFLLWHVSTSWRRSVETVLKSLALTHPQFVVLATVGWLTRHDASTTQAAIGKMAGLDPNTISQILKSLEDKKLIMRQTLSDGRVKNPFLTAAGADLLTRALPAVEGADAAFFASLSPQERAYMLQIFHKLTSCALYR